MARNVIGAAHLLLPGLNERDLNLVILLWSSGVFLVAFFVADAVQHRSGEETIHPGAILLIERIS